MDEDDERAILEVLRSDWLTQGPAVDQFEEALAEAVGARYAVCLSSGTAALHLAYLAAGTGPDDVVATSPITFVATANAALYCGARVEFVDVDPENACLTPEALEARLQSGLRPKIVVPVHYAGLPCDMERLGHLAERYGFRLVEDACHALGARYRLGDGQWGTVGDCRFSLAAVFSFHPVKHITTGEGGAVVTNDPDVRDTVRRLRSHGVKRCGFQAPEQATGRRGEPRPWYYEMHDLGYNYRLTDIQAALGKSQIRKLSHFLERRESLAARYGSLLRPLEQEGLLRIPKEPPGRRSAWHLYPVAIPHRRDAVHLALRSAGILTQVHYIPVHLQPYYRKRFRTAPGDFPIAERYFEETLSLPLYPSLKELQQDTVVSRLSAALHG